MKWSSPLQEQANKQTTTTSTPLTVAVKERTSPCSSPLQDYWSASTLTKQALPKIFRLLNSSVFLVFFTKQKVSGTRELCRLDNNASDLVKLSSSQFSVWQQFLSCIIQHLSKEFPLLLWFLEKLVYNSTADMNTYIHTYRDISNDTTTHGWRSGCQV
jgi:hypothetical protein